MTSTSMTAGLTATILALALAAGLATSAQAQSADSHCLDAAVEHVKGLGIEANDIKEVNFVGVVGNLQIGNIVELQAWTLLDSCKGSLVVKMTPLCAVKEDYSRGACTFANVKHF